MPLFQDILDKPAQERLKTNLNFNETRDVVASAGPYTNHLHLAADR